MTAPQILPRILVVGVGNPDRGDDGIGAQIATLLAAHPMPEVEVQTCRGDLLSLIEGWSGVQALICIDAAAPAGTPGRTTRLAAADPLPQLAQATSSHAFGLADTLALANTLDLLPPHVAIYAIEGACFDTGAPLTPAVAAAGTAAAAEILTELTRLRADLPQERADA